MQRDRWRKQAKKLDEERAQALYTDNTKQELLQSPYTVMPRRLWDLKSDRVVDFRMLHAEIQSTDDNASAQVYPTFWAVTHSWTDHMKPVKTSINQSQWCVPLPADVGLENVRAELLSFGAEYVWLDVLCLRQHSDTPALESIRQNEWKIDVPTIGNIYRAAARLVRYFNGLGRSFSKDGWDNPRHWLQRAWTLQEISTENMTFNGGMSRDNKGILLNTIGKLDGKEITLRRAMLPLLNLTAELHSPGGCSMYQLTRMHQQLQTRSLGCYTSCAPLHYQHMTQRRVQKPPGDNVSTFFHSDKRLRSFLTFPTEGLKGCFHPGNK